MLRVLYQGFGILLLRAFLGFDPLYAARAGVPNEPIHFFLAPHRNLMVDVTPKQVITVGDFKLPDARKFLMLAGGPEHFDYLYRSSTTFINTIGDPKCQLDSFPFSSVMPFSLQAEQFERRAKLLSQCVSIRLTDNALGGLKLPPQQPSCEVKRITKNTAEMRGRFCLAGIQPSSYFNVEYVPDPKCAQADAFASLGLIEEDFTVYSGIYLTGDDSGKSDNLENLGSVGLRITVEPNPQSLPLTPDYGTTVTRWPENTFLKGYLGNLSLSLLEENQALLDVGYLVNNQCSASCQGPKCVSACDYMAPLGLELTLSLKHKDGKLQYISQWYMGSPIPAQWQGLISGISNTKIPDFEEGATYQLRGVFSYPDIYYRLFKERYGQYLYDLSQLGDAIKSPFPPDSPASPKSPGAPIAPSLPLFSPGTDLRGGVFTQMVSNILQGINRLFHYKVWPPYLKRVCSSDQKCYPIYDGKFESISEIEFTGKRNLETGQLETFVKHALHKSPVTQGKWANYQSNVKEVCQ
jgi:hypothetical protein